MYTKTYKRTYENLEEARQRAQEESGYNSEQARRDMAAIAREKFGYAPYEWQVDVAEAFVLGMDATVIAPTGAGKSIPFALPLLRDRSKMIVIIYPLIALQQDQARRFRALGIKAAIVNAETWNAERDPGN